jgi:hypothetical protein
MFFFAGHDTTANALSAAVYYLAKNQVNTQSIYGKTPFIITYYIDDRIYSNVLEWKQLVFLAMSLKMFYQL